jgi:large subunit ribosomal protein L54
MNAEIYANSFIASKKLSKKAAKRAANKAQVETGTTSIPISEQSVDLPTGDGTQSGVMQALDASKDLTKALRAKRRATIKEANFLKTMS